MIKQLLIYISLFLSLLLIGIFALNSMKTDYHSSYEALDDVIKKTQDIVSNLPQLKTDLIELKSYTNDEQKGSYYDITFMRDGTITSIKEQANKVQVNRVLEKNQKQYVEYKYLQSTQYIDLSKYNILKNKLDSIKDSKINVVESGFHDIKLYLYKD